MDATLALVAALRALSESQRAVDILQGQVADLQAQAAAAFGIAEALESEHVPSGWRLTRDL